MIITDHKKVFENIDPSLLAKFREFHSANPHIYREFRENALILKNSGRLKSSAWLIINKMRWDFEISTNSNTEFKISNDFIALYSRLLIFRDPSFLGFFTLKPMKGQILD